MGSSWNIEEILQDQASKLYEMARTLEEAAEILRSLRDDGEVMCQYKNNLKRAKEWMKR